ncbi:MAG TPA: hypothetical protein VH501_00870 [Solirubrobacterales bacterium]|jgi:hypothetical protein
MSEVDAQTDDEELLREREVSVVRYRDRDPVTVRTTEVPGEELTREQRILAGLRRLAQEGRIPKPG